MNNTNNTGKAFPFAAKLVPTQGCYQKPIAVTVVGETPTCWRVQRPDWLMPAKYRKNTGLSMGVSDREFPRYKLEIES